MSCRTACQRLVDIHLLKPWKNIRPTTGQTSHHQPPGSFSRTASQPVAQVIIRRWTLKPKPLAILLDTNRAINKSKIIVFGTTGNMLLLSAHLLQTLCRTQPMCAKKILTIILTCHIIRIILLNIVIKCTCKCKWHPWFRFRNKSSFDFYFML